MPTAPVKRFRRLPDDEQSRVIEMAWEDRTPFEAIETLFGLAEPDVAQTCLLSPMAQARRWPRHQTPSPALGRCNTRLLPNAL